MSNMRDAVSRSKTTKSNVHGSEGGKWEDRVTKINPHKVAGLGAKSNGRSLKATPVKSSLRKIARKRG